jgi:hypothetical protein
LSKPGSLRQAQGNHLYRYKQRNKGTKGRKKNNCSHPLFLVSLYVCFGAVQHKFVIKNLWYKIRDIRYRNQLTGVLNLNDCPTPRHPKSVIRSPLSEVRYPFADSIHESQRHTDYHTRITVTTRHHPTSGGQPAGRSARRSWCRDPRGRPGSWRQSKGQKAACAGRGCGRNG